MVGMLSPLIVVLFFPQITLSFGADSDDTDLSNGLATYATVADLTGDGLSLLGGTGAVIGGVIKITGKIGKTIGNYQKKKPEDKIFEKLDQLDKRLQKLSTISDITKLFDVILELHYDEHVGSPMHTLKRRIRSVLNPRFARESSWKMFTDICENQHEFKESPMSILEQLHHFALQCWPKNGDDNAQNVNFFRRHLKRSKNRQIPKGFDEKVNGFFNMAQLRPKQKEELEKRVSEKSFVDAEEMFEVVSMALGEMGVPTSGVCLLKAFIDKSQLIRENINRLAESVREQLLYLSVAHGFCLNVRNGNNTDEMEKGVAESEELISEISKSVVSYLKDELEKAWPAAHTAGLERLLTQLEGQNAEDKAKQDQVFINGTALLKSVGDDHWDYFLVAWLIGDGHDFYYNCLDPKYCFLIENRLGLNIAVSRHPKDDESVYRNAQAATKLFADSIEPKLQNAADEYYLESMPTLVKHVEEKLGQKFLQENRNHMIVVSRWMYTMWGHPDNCKTTAPLAHYSCVFPGTEIEFCQESSTMHTGFLRDCRRLRWLFTV